MASRWSADALRRSRLDIGGGLCLYTGADPGYLSATGPRNTVFEQGVVQLASQLGRTNGPTTK